MPDARCRTCLAPLADLSAPSGWRCAACRRRPPPWETLLAAWYYEGPLRRVVLGLKFARLEHLGAAMGVELAERFAARLSDCDLVVPMPLHWQRAWTRGYNQAALIARPLAEALERPLAAGLRRRRRTRPQSGLDRDSRRRNLARAFVWRGSPPASRVLLVDDVYTTGATLHSAARALRAAGCRQLTALVFAATPHPAAARARE